MNIKRPLHISSLAVTILVGIAVVCSTAQAETEQEKRIREMGFVSVADDTMDIPEESRVPEPKVMNIPPRTTSFNINKVTDESDVEVEKLLAMDRGDGKLTVGEVEAIVVNGNASSDDDMVENYSASDSDIKRAASNILEEEPKTKLFNKKNTAHESEAFNYYTDVSSPDEFKGIRLGKTMDESAKLNYDYSNTKRRPSVEEQYSEFEDAEAMPPLEYNFASAEEYNGLPLFDGYVQVTAGYRVDDLDWNIASSLSGSTEPDILSELTWNDLQMWEIKSKAQVVFANHFVVDGKIGYGEIVEGENQDSDYALNNRNGEFSRSNNASDEGQVWDVSLAGGYRFIVKNPDDIFMVDELSMTLLGGYSYHDQELVMKEGFQTIPSTGSFAGLDSRYNAEWDGPWLGFELVGKSKNRKLTGYGRFEYHFLEYEGDATWNLRTDFKQPRSFEHMSDDGYGIVFDGGGHYQLTDIWALVLNFNLQYFHMDDGIDRVFFSNGSVVETRLNEVNWDSLSITAGATARF